jgi:hypothetical protein
MVAAVSYSIGYAGIDAVKQSSYHNTTGSCKVKIADMVNQAGAVVSASADSAQSAVRAKLSTLIDRSLCPGFGMCADVEDPADLDVWPITAITASFRLSLCYSYPSALTLLAAVHYRAAAKSRPGRRLRADARSAGLHDVDPAERQGRDHSARPSVCGDACQDLAARRRRAPQHDVCHSVRSGYGPGSSCSRCAQTGSRACVPWVPCQAAVSPWSCVCGA